MSATTLVTGATGFIGAHVVRRLLQRGEATRVLVRDPARLAPVGLADAEGLEIARGDLLEPATLAPALRGIRRLYHIAGYISTDRRETRRIHQLNYDATVRLLEQATAAGVERIVYLASIFALGAPAPGSRQPVDERVAYGLADYGVEYFRAKRRAELHVRERAAAGAPVVFVYPCFCLGPGDVNVSSSRLVEAFLQRRVPAYVPGGQNVMDVRDAARGLILGMDRGALGERYLVGGANVSCAELLDRLAALTGYRAPRLRVPMGVGRVVGRVAERLMRHPPLDEQSALVLGGWWYYDDTRARRELGHTSRPLDDTLADAVTWFCETGRCPWPPGFHRARGG